MTLSSHPGAQYPGCHTYTPVPREPSTPDVCMSSRQDLGRHPDEHPGRDRGRIDHSRVQRLAHGRRGGRCPELDLEKRDEGPRIALSASLGVVARRRQNPGEERGQRTLKRGGARSGRLVVSFWPPSLRGGGVRPVIFHTPSPPFTQEISSSSACLVLSL